MTHTLTGSFTAPGALDLVVAKVSRLELYSVEADGLRDERVDARNRRMRVSPATDALMSAYEAAEHLHAVELHQMVAYRPKAIVPCVRPKGLRHPFIGPRNVLVDHLAAARVKGSDRPPAQRAAHACLSDLTPACGGGDRDDQEDVDAPELAQRRDDVVAQWTGGGIRAAR